MCIHKIAHQILNINHSIADYKITYHLLDSYRNHGFIMEYWQKAHERDFSRHNPQNSYYPLNPQNMLIVVGTSS
jgi:hypothetical protein